jgi:hypothetical protein
VKFTGKTIMSFPLWKVIMKIYEINRLKARQCIDILYDESNDEMYLEVKELKDLPSIAEIMNISHIFRNTLLGKISLMSESNKEFVEASWIKNLGVLSNNSDLIKKVEEIRCDLRNLIEQGIFGCAHDSECIFSPEPETERRHIKICSCFRCPIWEKLAAIPGNENTRIMP